MSDPSPTLDSPPEAVAAAPRTFGAGRAVWVLLAYFLVQLAAGIAGGLVSVIYATSHGIPASGAVAWFLQVAVFPTTFVTLLASGLVVYRIVRRSFPGSLASGAMSPIGWVPSTQQAMLWGALAGGVVALLYVRVAVPLWPPNAHQELGPFTTAAATAQGWPRALWAVTVLLMAPPLEEFIFRGALLAGLTRSFGSLSAGVLVTTIFVASHLTETYLYYPAIGAIALVGVCTLMARLQSGSLLTGIAVHGAYNLVIVVSVYSRAVQ